MGEQILLVMLGADLPGCNNGFLSQIVIKLRKSSADLQNIEIIIKFLDIESDLQLRDRELFQFKLDGRLNIQL